MCGAVPIALCAAPLDGQSGAAAGGSVETAGLLLATAGCQRVLVLCQCVQPVHRCAWQHRLQSVVLCPHNAAVTLSRNTSSPHSFHVVSLTRCFFCFCHPPSFWFLPFLVPVDVRRVQSVQSVRYVGCALPAGAAPQRVRGPGASRTVARRAGRRARRPPAPQPPHGLCE